MKYRNMEDRLIANSIITDSGCWEWIGRQDGRGYGHINVRREGRHTTLKAHRVAYEELVGPIPEDHEVDHTCYNPLCINPNHLEAVTKSENLARRRY